MLFQIIFSTGEPAGVLQVSFDSAAHDPADVSRYVEMTAKICAKKMWEGNDPDEHFWENLIGRLEENRISAERVFLDEINL